ncbi:hypothetical protein EZV62_010811 [Acer yangbiense]|uniref:Uncharacterized protein n=1 Tax=Acer yangbiense TaxID=1000413 RepID=A0A5C7I3F9_9ROSI|nr:hypothetical protein EZV62_010811 [Acer yangbiense]
MLSFRVFVKYVNDTVDMDLIEPRDCSVISLINDAMKELKGHHIEPWEKWQLSITLSWNGLRHMLTTDEELMFCFEKNVEHPNDEPVGEAATDESDGSVVPDRFL